MSNFEREHIDNIKHVLFGDQKQADDINNVVAIIVANELEVHCGYNTSSTCSDIVDYIRDYLQRAIDSEQGGSAFYVDSGAFMLIAGETSFNNLMSGEPIYLDVYQNDDMSTKYFFRIHKLGEESDNPSKVGALATGSFEVTPRDGDSSKTLDNVDFYTRACRERDKILPTVPDAVKTEIPDNDFAQALCCAEAYYKNS